MFIKIFLIIPGNCAAVATIIPNYIMRRCDE